MEVVVVVMKMLWPQRAIPVIMTGTEKEEEEKAFTLKDMQMIVCRLVTIFSQMEVAVVMDEERGLKWNRLCRIFKLLVICKIHVLQRI